MRAIAAGVLVGALFGSALAQPSQPDMDRAKDLYRAAEEAMKAGRFSDAVRDYGGAYEITRDPVLFYKIGSANQAAGKCEVALIYFNRYLREGRPSETFQKLAKEKIEACGGTAPTDAKPAGTGTTTTTGTTGTGTTGTTGTGATTTTGTGTQTGTTTTTGPDTTTTTGPGTTTTGPGTTTTTGTGTGDTITVGTGPAETPKVVVGGKSNKAAWVLVATSVGFITVGAVLAYSASSAESDITDLYQGLGGMAPTFDARTKATYDDLVDEGERYEKLSWVSFGLAGVTGIAAAVLFWKNSGKDESAVQVAPTASASGGGVSARWRF